MYYSATELNEFVKHINPEYKVLFKYCLEVQ